jgi:type II secretory pathway predicted ATPase ExeA
VLRLVASGLGIATPGLEKAQLLERIEAGLHGIARSGRRTLLIVDEAQALPVSALEELRMLSNFQAGGQALVQIFLLGQPEFRERLHGADALEQLRQRVIAVHHLEPMEPEEIEPYMIHRLALVGWQGRPDFTGEALDALYKGSGGVPRILNQLATRVLLYGAIEKLELIDADTVEAVIDDLKTDAPGADEPFEPIAPGDADEVVRRIAMLEARVEEQNTALRRVLTLLVDWVEADTARHDGARESSVA